MEISIDKVSAMHKQQLKLPSQFMNFSSIEPLKDSEKQMLLVFHFHLTFNETKLHQTCILKHS